ncbi:MAG: c-type cytochrome [Burkholderiaceae bacterium]|nr:c-type cytochrome [Burkholderiaceae bacterium]
MRNSITLACAISFTLSSGVALADASLAKAKNCFACHTIESKLVGPAYKDVAKKYASDKGAADRLAKKIRAGGSGVWGQIPMPASPQVNEAEAAALAKWIMSLK